MKNQYHALFAIFIMCGFLCSGLRAEEPATLPAEGKLAIEMAPYDFSLIQRGRLRGKVSLTLTLVVEKQRDSEMIRQRLPQIRSDFLNGLTTLSRQRFNVNRPIDPDVVTAFLMPYLNHRVGEGKARVYVKHAQIKPGQ